MTGPVVTTARGATVGSAADLTAPWHHLSLVVAEDDPDAVALLRGVIGEALSDVTVRWATDVAAATELLAAARPDCVLLDLDLPDAKGIDALERIIKADAVVPIIAMTGIDDEHFGILSVASGAQDYLVKPRVAAETLRKSVMYGIERKRGELATVEIEANRLRVIENARLEKGLLPTPRLLPDPGVHVVASYRPSRTDAFLGGDFYDVVQTPDRVVHVVIGDVSGHGADSAALGAALRIGWRTLTASGVHGAERMHRLSWLLRAERRTPGAFATALTLSMHPEDTRLTVVRAGHPGMLWHRRDDVEWVLPRGGPALGIGRPDRLGGPDHADRWPEEHYELPRGTALVLLTDGLFEAHCGMGEQRLGEDRLLTLARSLADLPGEAFVETLITRVEQLSAARGGLSDDVAVVRVARTG